MPTGADDEVATLAAAPLRERLAQQL